MSRFRMTASVLAFALVCSAGTALAQGRGQGRGKPPATSPGKVSKPSPGKAAGSQPVRQPRATPGFTVPPKLPPHLQPLLPGIDLNTAAQGFRNLGQFVAAAHVSNNLDIPFSDLKTRMVVDGLSLGQAIQDLRPRVNATSEAAKADRQARSTIARGR